MSAPIPADIIAAAQAAQAKWHIPASISIAQWAVESGRGTHMPPNSNNPFGIKAVTGQPSVIAHTREVDKYGRSYYIDAGFRKFDNIADAFDEHGKLLATSGHYANARSKLPSADAFADALTGVYATDPHYGTALKAIMRGGNFYQYDEPPVAPPATAPTQLHHHSTLRRGMTGGEVHLLQSLLGIATDSIFGEDTETVLKAYQAHHGLTADGVAGPATWAKLDG